MEIKNSQNIIEPVAAGIRRPLWSVMIPVYNPGEFLLESIRSVLKQFPGEDKMQIEVVDDCSPDVNVQELLSELSDDRVAYYRNPVNQGHSFNFTECLRRAKGELIHLLHQDDIVNEGFYSAFEKIFEKYKDAGAVYCRQSYIDENGSVMFYSEPDLTETGILEDAVVKLAEKQRVQYCAMAVRRRVYEDVGGFIAKNIGCEDWEMWVRIASKYKIVYEPEALASYRVHNLTSMTLREMRTGLDMRDMMEASEIFDNYVPKDKREQVKLFRRKHYGKYSLENARRLFTEFKDEEGAAAQLTETIRLDSETVFENSDLLSEFSIPVDGTGVSVIICTENNEDVIEHTLKCLIYQNVPDYIPWEIIVSDNNSSDRTLETAIDILSKSHCKFTYRIFENKDKDLNSIRNRAVTDSRYNFIVFCEPGNFLNTNFIHNASKNMMKNSDAGVIGGYIEDATESVKPEWFGEYISDIFETGEQYENNSDITWSRGYVWSSGMVIRKEAFISLIQKHFVPLYERDNRYGYSFSKELCFALRLTGWRIFYSVDLRLTKFICGDKLRSGYLKLVQRHNGAESVYLSPYTETKLKRTDDFSKLKFKLNVRSEFRKCLHELRKINNTTQSTESEKTFPDRNQLKADYLTGKTEAILKDIKSYNRRLRFIKKYSRKKEISFFRTTFNSEYFRFPQYKIKNDRRGVSVILEYKNKTADIFYRCLGKIADQVLPSDFKWEILIISGDNDKDFLNGIKKIKSLYGCGAEFRTINEVNSGLHHILNTGIKYSRYDTLIFLNDLNFIESDYVRIAYKSVSKNKQTGIVTGNIEFTSDVKPPKWFKEYKHLYKKGNIFENGFSISGDNHSTDSDGFVIKKQTLKEITDSKPVLNGKVESNGAGDSEIANSFLEKLNSPGFKIRLEPRLKIKKFITVRKFSWEYLRDLNFRYGTEKARTEIAGNPSSVNGNGNSTKWIYRANRTLGELKKHSFKKIFSGKEEYNGDTEVLEIEELKGKFRAILKNKDKFIQINSNGKYNGSSNGSPENFRKGVSVVICCYNSSKVIRQTLLHIIRQKVTDKVNWEVIIVDNASTDNTSDIADRFWKEHNCLADFKIVKEQEPGLSAARQKGIDASGFEYIIFCDDDNHLEENFIERAYEVMCNDDKIGVLGGQSIAKFETLPKYWFKDWDNSFAIGKQNDQTGDITWSRGYVWGAAMTIRKTAWKKLISGGFRSKLTDRKGNLLSAGGDTEICYALRNEGWKIYYDDRLKFIHFITGERLKWEYLRKLFRGFGVASTGLDEYLKQIPLKIRKRNRIKVPQSARKELHRALRILRETRYSKLLTFKRRREGDTDIPMIEYTSGRIESILKNQHTYNRGLKLLKRTAYKNDFRYLKSVFRKYGNNFPKYRISEKFNGVSVIVCTYNGADRLADTIRHIARQKVDPGILWEVILVDNASTDNSKEAAREEWNKHKCRAKLRIVDQPVPGKQLALEKGYEEAKYEYWITCDDDNWLEENFVQLTYEIMSSNKNVGALGGPNEALCELEPPEWFKWFQKDYAAGPQGDIYTGKVSEGDITWKRGFVWGAGMVVRKSAWEKLIADGFRTSMSCRKGTELSSGGDSEACYALVLAGWHVWYDTRLKLKHCMPAGRLHWDYLTRLFSGFGVATVGLELYEKAIKLGHADKDEKEILKQNWNYEIKKAIRELRKYGLKKILSLRFSQDGKTEIPMLEFYIAKVKELWKVRKEYDKKFEEIRNAPWKKSFSELRNEHRKFLEKENDFRYGWPWTKESIGTAVAEDSEVKDYPKISILTPSFNSESTIEKAILSVLNQQYPNFEHIICDGGSKDGTVEILKKYPHLKWVSEPDKGQSDAMNKAFDMSTGEIISYLNADDYYSRGAFLKIAKEFKKNPSAEMVVGNLFFEFDNHTFTRNAEIDYKKIMLPFRYMFPINPVSYFYKRNVQTETGPFPLDNHFTMDYWFLLKAYQNHRLAKTEDYLGTFCMNGYNKTSNADNRKNTHIRVLYHCWHYDKKNLPYYLYNYYKFFYYDKKPYNLTNLWNKAGKNLGRIYSVITLRKNKYYNEKLYQSARNSFYSGKKFRSAVTLLTSYMIYPKAVKQKSRFGLLSYSVFGIKNTEKLKWFYFFLTTPPGLPLANKLHYFGNKFKTEKKSFWGSLLLFLTYLISPKFIFKENYYKKDQSSTGFKLKYMNPFYWLKAFVNFFRYRKYRDVSYNLYLKSAEKFYFHKYFKSVLYMLLSFFVYPFSVFKRSRLNQFAYSALGEKNTGRLKILYHLYKDNPEYTLAHKLHYYGNDFKIKGNLFKGNMILMLTYIISPKYIFRPSYIPKPEKIRFRDKSFVQKLSYLNPLYWLASVINFFRYKKYKEISYNYYIKAGEKYYFHKNIQAVLYLLTSFFIYPLSVAKKSRLNLFMYSFFGNRISDKFMFAYHLYKDNPEYSFPHKLNYYGNELRKEGRHLKGNSVLLLTYILSPKYISKREKIKKAKTVYVSESMIPKMDIPENLITGKNFREFSTVNTGRFRINHGFNFKNLPGIIKYRLVLVYHYFRYRKFKAKSKELYTRAQESYHNNKRFDTVKLLLPSFLLYPVSIVNRNKLSLMYNSIFGNSHTEKPENKN